MHSSEDARRIARRKLPWLVFDYIDGAAGDEKGADRNRAALDELTLRPRILRDVSERSLSVPIFGRQTRAPFGIAPMGMCNLSSPGADLMLARLAARENVPLGVSTVASTAMEPLIEEAEGNAWFQLYYSGDGTTAYHLVDRAKAAGYDTLIFTVDVPELGRRRRELRHGYTTPFRIGPRQFIDFALHPRWSLKTLAHGRPKLVHYEGLAYRRTDTRAKADWDTLKRLRDTWPGKLVIKGVLDPDDSVALRDTGVDAIQVSSHGARQLESGPCPIHALPEIRAAVGSKMPLFYDSGLRSGDDVVKAYGLGANFTFLGRVLQFAIAAGGEEGLRRMWEVFTEETSITMAQVGKNSLTDQPQEMVCFSQNGVSDIRKGTVRAAPAPGWG